MSEDTTTESTTSESLERADQTTNDQQAQNCDSGHPETDKEMAIRNAADSVAQRLNADVLLYAGLIKRVSEIRVLDLVLGRRKRPHVLLVMCTSGGDADVAYLISKCLQNNYKRFTFFVPGYCKSAGTLVAIGANDLVFSQYGELGPLDIQLPKKDELGGQRSGWAVVSALDEVIENAFDAWKTVFLRIIGLSGGQITVRTAATIAADLTTGLLSPVCAQINPIYLGEVGRQLMIAKQYGEMLNKVARNLKPQGLDRLIQGYPSHGFVIDRLEAEHVFENVRVSDGCEEDLRTALGPDLTHFFSGEENPYIAFLSDELEDNQSGR